MFFNFSGWVCWTSFGRADEIISITSSNLVRTNYDHNFTQSAYFIKKFVSSILYRPTDFPLLKEFSKNVSFSNSYKLPSQSVVQKLSMSMVYNIILLDDWHHFLDILEMGCELAIISMYLLFLIYKLWVKPFKENYATVYWEVVGKNMLLQNNITLVRIAERLRRESECDAVCL